MAAGPARFNRTTLRCAGRRVGPPALLLGATLLLGACSVFAAPRELRGNRVDPEQLREITPGVQTKQDVVALIGSPSLTGSFDQNHWYYLSSTTHIRPGRVPGVEDQRVVAVVFSDAGVVREVREVPRGDMRQIEVVSRETPVPGSERTLLQALFGNVGRFGAGPLSAGADQGPNSGPGSSSGR